MLPRPHIQSPDGMVIRAKILTEMYMVVRSTYHPLPMSSQNSHPFSTPSPKASQSTAPLLRSAH